MFRFVAYFALGFLILLGVIALLRAYVSADPARLARIARRVAMASAGLGAALLLLRVPLGLLFLALGGALPLALQWRALWSGAGGSPKASSGRSRVDTKYLHLELDHATGMLDGRVLAGKHRERPLAALTLDELLEVRAECLAEDAQGVPLIEAYLDRIHGPEWRSRESAAQSSGEAPQRPSSTTMTREEAYEVLGLKPGTSAAEINEAHHRLIKKLHSDHGGSDYLAAKINQARDVLLGA
jgi:hypothetical protein